MFETSESSRLAFKHQQFSYQAARVGQSVRKQIRFREQQQARCFRAVGADHDRLRLLKLFLLLRIEEDHSIYAAALVGGDLPHIATRADFTTSGSFAMGMTPARLL